MNGQPNNGMKLTVGLPVAPPPAAYPERSPPLSRSTLARRMAFLAAAVLVSCGPPPPPNDQPNWHVEENAKPSESHPFGGFWKPDNCELDAGLAIGPMGENTYYVSFCGPGGCFAEGTYRAETTIVDDPAYRIIDDDTIELEGRFGIWPRYVRCTGREGGVEQGDAAVGP
jgi:hypothetical protein